ncbi:beta-1,4-N-acetylgalactosaminyltransferase bre-4 [Condylostylus longicornis]|uniref:beta-1,4-N-acetylgalactosaminyltransferase bre-4 n=1 Tax=Condylostylus longicornis TaxID=2530218 RepID=UPI00244DD47D|nr:beta-1,4-N-acetylgalactosaminyltransferase bre-4 [Condylostylus longicornis]
MILNGLMASRMKCYVFKAVIFIGIVLLVFFNLFNKEQEVKLDYFAFSHSKLLRLSSIHEEKKSEDNSSENIYTLIYGNNSNIEGITFNTHNSSLHSNHALLIESSDFKRTFYEVANSNETENLYNNSKTIGNITLCPMLPPDLNGPYEVDTKYEATEVVEKRFKHIFQPGGFFTPKHCAPRFHVAIIVPFRDRYTHLPIFLKNIHPFLMKQLISYEIFIVEQTNGKPFNRASLMNVGFVEALKFYNWDCFIFHDVDLLPLDDRNLYTCPDQPRHMSVGVDIFGYKLPYNTIFGGVSSLTTKQFQAVNGFSNSFWGWGGEDDDMSNRLKHAKFHISRYPINIARYTMLNHKKEKANPKRFENLAYGARKFKTDGLNSLKYEIYTIKKLPLYTWLFVDLQMQE